MAQPREFWCDAAFIARVCELAVQAGEITLKYWRTEIEVMSKGIEGPVTIADKEADIHIVRGLRSLTPDVTIVSEEGTPVWPPSGNAFWLVDPLDGTRSFIRGEASYSVNIGLVIEGAPVFGVLYHPPQKALYWNDRRHAWRRIGDGDAERITTRSLPAEGWTVLLGSRTPSRAMQDYLKKYPVQKVDALASALKWARLAEGMADFHPRFQPTMEWDTAAGHAILEAAGGRVTTLDGQPFRYGKENYANGEYLAYSK